MARISSVVGNWLTNKKQEIRSGHGQNETWQPLGPLLKVKLLVGYI